MPTGGGATSDIEAGGAFVRVSTKDDATREMKVIFGNIKKEGVKAAGGMNPLAQSFGKVGQSFSKVMGGVVGGVALLDLAKTAAKAKMGLGEYNLALEESARLSTRLQEVQAKARDRILEKVGGNLAVPVKLIAEGDRAAFLEEQLKQAQKNLTTVGRDADAANEKVRELLFGLGPAMIDHLNVPFAVDALQMDRHDAKQAADELNAKHKALQDYVQLLREQKAAQEAAEKARPLVWQQSMADLNADLDVQLATITMTADEAALYKKHLEGVKANAKDINQQLEVTRGKMKGIRDTEALMKAKQAFGDFDKDLEFRLRTAGMSPEQVQLEKMKGDDQFNMSKENEGNRKALLAMMGDLQKMGGLEDFKAQAKKDAAKGFGAGSVAGSFSLRPGMLGLASTWNREDMSGKVDKTNEWLKEIFGALKPAAGNPPDGGPKVPKPENNREGFRFDAGGLQRVGQLGLPPADTIKGPMPVDNAGQKMQGKLLTVAERQESLLREIKDRTVPMQFG